MKRILFMALAVLLAAVACTKSNPGNGGTTGSKVYGTKPITGLRVGSDNDFDVYTFAYTNSGQLAELVQEDYVCSVSYNTNNIIYNTTKNGNPDNRITASLSNGRVTGYISEDYKDGAWKPHYSAVFSYDNEHQF